MVVNQNIHYCVTIKKGNDTILQLQNILMFIEKKTDSWFEKHIPIFFLPVSGNNSDAFSAVPVDFVA